MAIAIKSNMLQPHSTDGSSGASEFHNPTRSLPPEGGFDALQASKNKWKRCECWALAGVNTRRARAVFNSQD
ncbi:UNVERIFIED_CONTAM: hypothetical protein NY603_22995, partial [Bacteroidetes bacterium 56_B9]